MGLFASPCTSTGTTTHSHRQRRRFAALALAALLTMSALALVGCASNHPITKSGEQCASCHSDGRAAVEGTGSASATETGLTFAVESGADEVYLCTAAVAEDRRSLPRPHAVRRRARRRHREPSGPLRPVHRRCRLPLGHRSRKRHRIRPH